MGGMNRSVLVTGDNVKIWNRQKDKSKLEFAGVAKLVKFCGMTRPGQHDGDPVQEQWTVKFADGHSETRWVSFLDLFMEPKNYSEAVGALITPTPITPPATETASKGYDKELLKLAATILVDCIHNPSVLTVDQSLGEVGIDDEERAEIYSILAEFEDTLIKKYDIVVSEYEAVDKDEEWTKDIPEPKPETPNDEAVGGTA